jgi:predicted dehydrogenase
MSNVSTIRTGIIGLGSMGRQHARTIREGRAPGLELTAVADIDPEALTEQKDVACFSDAEALIASGKVDAVLIATPHYDHTTLGIAALKAGLHTLVEKPIGVHKADCERLIAAHTDPSIVFAAMFNQRTDPAYLKLKQLIETGELGKIQRINWVITDWYRTECYYRQGGWRATWAGEGGGVLLNQCPHNLDLWQWLFGMPETVTAMCQFGRFHHIEVEDAVTALLSYPDGMTGVFVTTTGEAPGTNRLEVAADRGKVVIEGGNFSFQRTEVSVQEHCSSSDSPWARPAVWDIDIPIHGGKGPQHARILKNFAEAIRGEAELIAPAAQGLHSVELAGAMLTSAWQGACVTLPLDAAAYEAALQQRIKDSTYIKPEVVKPINADINDSF